MIKRRKVMAKKASSKKPKSTTKPENKTQAKNATTSAAKGTLAPMKDQVKKETVEAQAAPRPEPKASATKPTKTARAPRLPEPGTVLQKKDRQGTVRCECTVEENGIRYQGTLYRSLSAAAMAASKDMGLGGRAQNGFLFWGLIKQTVRAGDPVAALEKTWARYETRAKVILETDLDEELREKLQAVVRKHAAALEGMQGQVA
jgi:hypothetical protein